MDECSSPALLRRSAGLVEEYRVFLVNFIFKVDVLSWHISYLF
jgi:hypothetical protein